MPAIRLDNTGAIDYIGSSTQNITTTQAAPNYAIVNHTASAIRVTVSGAAGETFGLLGTTPAMPAVTEWRDAFFGTGNDPIYMNLFRPGTAANSGFIFARDTGTGGTDSDTNRLLADQLIVNTDGAGGDTVDIRTAGTMIRLIDPDDNVIGHEMFITTGSNDITNRLTFVRANANVNGTSTPITSTNRTTFFPNTDFDNSLSDVRTSPINQFNTRVQVLVTTTPAQPEMLNINPFGNWTVGTPSAGDTGVFASTTTNLILTADDSDGDDVSDALTMLTNTGTADTLRLVPTTGTTITATVNGTPTLQGGLVTIPITARSAAPVAGVQYSVQLTNRRFTVGGSGAAVAFTTIIDKRSAFISGQRPNAHTAVNDGIGSLPEGTVFISAIEPVHTDVIESVDDNDIDNIIYLLHLTDPVTFNNMGVGSTTSAITTTTATPDFILINNTASAVRAVVEGEVAIVDKRSYIRSGPISNAHTDVRNTMNRVPVGSIDLDSVTATHTGVIDPNSNNFYFLLAN